MSRLYDPKSFKQATSVTTSVTDDGHEECDEELAPQPSSEELDMFKQQVQQWAKLDDQMRKLSVALRERRVQQKALGSKIQEFMVQYSYDNLNTNTGRIRSTVRQVKQPMKLNEIKEKVKQIAGTEIADKIFDEEGRPLVERRSLRRIVPKVDMTLDI